MDGAKANCRYVGSCLNDMDGRQAWRLDRSRAVRSCGPVSSADPGGSNSIAR